MGNQTEAELVARAKTVLQGNDRGQWTVPSAVLYPHQWLWDSCFIAIGMRHYDARRAAREIESLFRGQWENGMLPNIIFTPGGDFRVGPDFWQANLSESAPAAVATSGITQPPLVAVAALAVAEKLPETEAQVFLNNIYTKLVMYHNWIYHERDPEERGLAVLLHPWESGLDNSPPWMKALGGTPIWISVLLKSGGMSLFNRFRRDITRVPAEQKLTDIEALKLLNQLYRLRKNHYDSRLILEHSHETVEDVVFNSILVAANRALVKIAALIAEDLPADLLYRSGQTEQALESLWSQREGQYLHRNYRRKKLIRVNSIATLLPLFSGAITPARAAELVQLLKNPNKFWTAFPLPSVPIDAAEYKENRYWQGPTWINTNWLIIQGLLTYGYQAEAAALRKTCLDLVARSGFYEYFSALSGKGLGIDNFSWTAALLIDLVNLKID